MEMVRERFPTPPPPSKPEKAAMKTNVRVIRKVSYDLEVNSLVPNKLKEEAFKVAKALKDLADVAEAV